MATTLNQNCVVTQISGATVFQITSFLTAVDPTELPFTEIFVYSISAATDPKTDVFQRVANILDLTTLQQSRDAAITANSALYLSSSFVVNFSDVLTATNAKLLIQQRVDALITAWQTYTTAFIVPNQVSLPATSSTIVQAAIAEYNTAEMALVTAQAALTASTAAVTAAQAADTTAIASLTSVSQDTAACSQANTLFGAGYNGEVALRTAINTFLTQVNAFTAAGSVVGSTWVVDLTAFTNFSTTYLSAITSAVTTELTAGKANLDALNTFLFVGSSSMCVKKSAAAITAAQAKNTADATLSTAQSQQTQATAAVATAQTAADTALANAVAVCPTFTPS